MHNIAALPREGDGDPLSDEVALVRAARQEPSAFGTLYDRYLGRIYAYLRARTSNDEEAADLTQQVFLQALDALPRYREGRVPFAAWLFCIARNVAIDAHRRRRTSVAWDLVPEALQPVAAHDLEAGALRREDIARLRALLDALDSDTRELLALRFAAALT